MYVCMCVCVGSLEECFQSFMVGIAQGGALAREDRKFLKEMVHCEWIKMGSIYLSFLIFAEMFFLEM